MSWTQLRGLWRRIVAGERVDRELDEELRSYVDLLADEKVAQGWSPEDARRSAAIETGGVEQVKEMVRANRFGAWIEDAARDARYGARQLARTPGFTAAATLALALGVGAATAIFSAVDAVLLKPLPYPESDRLVVVLHDGIQPVAPATYDVIRRHATSFDAVGAAEAWRPNLATDGSAEAVTALRLTAATVAMTGARPLLGRLFGPEEEEPGREHVVLLGHGLWRRQFAADPGVIGRDVRLDGEPYTVVGVMPPGFDFPPFWTRGAQMWAPLPLRDRIDSRGGRSLRLFARLAADASLPSGRDQVAAIAARVEAEHPGTMKGLVVRPLQDVVVRNVRSGLLVLLGAVALLLLAACANVAHMLLARAAGRESEIAVRTALGAGRSRMIRQLLTESLLLATLGTAFGIGIAWAGTRLLVASHPPSLPRIETMGIDVRVLAVASLLSVVCALAFGLAPALQAFRVDTRSSLCLRERGATGGAGSRRLRSVLVASEVALALVLLVGAGLLIRTFAALHAVDPGFDPRGLLALEVSLAGSKASAVSRRAAFYTEALERLRSLPGVEAAGAINHLPLAGDIWGASFHVRGRPPAEPGLEPTAAFRVVLPGYFEAMCIDLVRGRDFDARDDRSHAGVVIVNEALAQAHLWGEDPIGRSMTLDDPESPDAEWLTVVGVSRNAVRSAWAEAPEPEVYLPFLQQVEYLENPGGPFTYLTYVLRASGDPASLAPGARAVVRSLARDAAVSDVQTMEAVVSRELAEPRLYVVLLAGFATVALVLAAIGIYGVVSYSVSRRRREIAIRMALGAGRDEIVRLVLGQGLRTVAVGTAVGVAGALALARTISGLLYGVPPGDPLTLGMVVLVLGGVALVAMYVPVRGAAAVRALESLRHE